MFGYIGNLRAMSSGRASYTMEFSHYDELPGHLADKVIADAKISARLTHVVTRRHMSPITNASWRPRPLDTRNDMSRLMVRIYFREGERLGPGKVALLEAIDASGSITAAAKTLGMSYRRAWLLVEEMNAMFEPAVVETAHGGARGGA